MLQLLWSQNLSALRFPLVSGVATQGRFLAKIRLSPNAASIARLWNDFHNIR